MARTKREDAGFDDGGDRRDDRLSGPDAIERRAVHPYRDRRETLIARRRALRDELTRAEQAAKRRNRLSGQLEAIDDELRAESAPLLERIAITTPCRAPWDAMQGDDAVRHCGRCHRDVHDLAQMTEAEIETLFARAEGACVRLRRRRDGRVVTAECPAEPPTVAARAARVMAAGMLFGAGAVSAAATLATLSGVEKVALPSSAMPSAPPYPTVPHVDVDRLRSPALEDELAADAVTMGVPEIEPSPSVPRIELDRHIRWIAPQAWELDRALLDRVLTDPPDTHGRFLPTTEGLRVYGVRRHSLLGRLGLQNGDVLLDVNGIPLSSLGNLLEAHAALEGANALFVRIERRGEERLHVYRIAAE